MKCGKWQGGGQRGFPEGVTFTLGGKTMQRHGGVQDGQRGIEAGAMGPMVVVGAGPEGLSGA